MYNHLTNNWGDGHHEIPYDMRHPETNEHIKAYLKEWLESHVEVDVVRFTTFFYHFTLIYNEMKKEKFVDWFGYSFTLSHEAKELVDMAHSYGKEAMMFLGDNWIGTEPYGK